MYSDARTAVRVETERRGAALALLCGTQLLLLVDFSIVNIALPDIRQALGFSPSGLAWVVSAYALTFGGFLLLGGRLADLLGRRRLFVAGLVLFGLASLVGGLAQSSEVLVVMRAIQGGGAALIAPALLSLITTLYPEGPERDRAVGWFTAASASGFGLGVLAGGVLTSALGWRAIFLMNVPLIAVAIPVAYLLLREPGRLAPPRRGYDVAGAVLGVAGLTMVSYGLTVAPRPGLLGRGVAFVAAGAVLLGVLLLVERKARDPLLPLGLFRLPNLAAALGVGALGAGVLGTATLLLSLYLQEVRELSALWAGVFFLPFGVAIAVAAQAAPWLTARLGLRGALATAALLMAAGAGALSVVAAGDGHLAAVLLAMLVVAAGFGVFYTLFTLAGTAGVAPGQQGIAAGLVNTATQVGTAFAAAILVTLAGVHGGAGAAASGFVVAFAAAAAILVAAAALAATTVR
jgi:MFS family permease